MVRRIFGAVGLVALVATTPGLAQAAKKGSKEPMAQGRPLSAWVADLKALSPQTRNAAAYAISGMGPAGAPAVPALIEALGDSSPAVRYPVTVALREIGPAAKTAVPALKKLMDEDINDEIASSARRAIRKIDPAALTDDE